MGSSNMCAIFQVTSTQASKQIGGVMVLNRLRCNFCLQLSPILALIRGTPAGLVAASQTCVHRVGTVLGDR